MASVTLSQLTKHFKEVVAVDEVDLVINDREFLVLVGPSGCGKSTCLRMIAGLEEATGGEIYIGERPVNDVSPKDRDIAMVFQNYALYPHMSVYENMAFGLKLRMLKGVVWQLTHWEEAKRVKQDIRDRVIRVAEMLDLVRLLERKPKQLSGGERQRVALGRAIVREPKVFLMDEPLSNLDAKLRVQTRAELIKLHRQLGITTIYVTHDQVEAMTMGDRIAVMKDGVILQCDTPMTLYHHPVNVFVATFIGSPSMNMMDARVVANGDGIHLEAGELKLAVTAEQAEKLAGHKDQDVFLGIRPSDLYVKSNVPPNITVNEGDTFSALCEVSEPMGNRCHLYLSRGGNALIADVAAEHEFEDGVDIDIVVDTERLHVFDKKTEAALC